MNNIDIVLLLAAQVDTKPYHCVFSFEKIGCVKPLCFAMAALKIGLGRDEKLRAFMDWNTGLFFNSQTAEALYPLAM